MIMKLNAERFSLSLTNCLHPVNNKKWRWKTTKSSLVKAKNKLKPTETINYKNTFGHVKKIPITS